MTLIEVTANDRPGRTRQDKCDTEITIGDLKKLPAATEPTVEDPSKIQLKKTYTIFKNHITLEDYEIQDGMVFELY